MQARCGITIRLLALTMLVGGCMMRTQVIEFQEGLIKGLRTKKEHAKNIQVLTELDGMRACEFGLAEHTPITEFWPELVTNGTFIGNADGWTLGACWAYAANNVVFTAPSEIGEGGGIYQDIGAVEDGLYMLTFTVSALGGGATCTPKMGGDSGTEVTADGTYTQYIQAGGGVGEYPFDQAGVLCFWGQGVEGATFTVDDVSCKKFSLGPDLVTNGDFAASTGWTLNTGWAIAAGKLSHSAGSTLTAEQAFPYIELVVGALYEVTVTVNGNESGGIVIALGTGTGASIGLNATYTQYITCATNTVLSITPSADWIGDVDDIIVKRVLSTDWPFPQLFRGENTTLMAESTRLLDVDESSLTGPHTSITTYDARNTGDTKAITGEAPWHFAEFQNSWFMFNGTCMVYKIPSTASGKVVVEDTVRIKTGCVFGDRLLLANFYAASYFDGDDWAEIWDIWQKYSDAEQFTYLDMAIGANWVMWSRPLGGDIYRPFGNEMALFQIPSSTAFDNVKARLITDIKNRDIGFIQMPFRGEIYAVKQLGGQVIVYGADGIAVMVPHEKGFRVKSLLRTGLGNRSMVNGDERNHVFVDAKGNVWVIDAELRLNRVDYKEFIQPVVGANGIVSHDPQRNDFYICESGAGYVLSEGALAGLRALPTSIVTIDDALVAPLEYTGSLDRFSFVTDTFNMGRRFDVKTIQSVQLSVENITELQVQIQWRDAGGDSFTSNDWTDCNDFGAAVVVATGLEFRIGVRGLLGTDAKIDSIAIEWKDTGKRSVGSLI